MVALPNLLSGNVEELNRFKQSFEAHGWVLLTGVDQRWADLGTRLEAFFGEGEKEKQKYDTGSPIGYSAVRGVGQEGNIFKEKLSYIVGDADVARASKKGPPPWLMQEIPLMEGLTRQVAERVSPAIFGCPPAQLDFPFFKEAGSRWSLFDVACYTNRHTSGVPPLNCTSHYDPGLFAFSFWSNAAGLQVQDQKTKQFIDVPYGLGKGIIWAGDAAHQASGGRVPRGIHRVIYPKDVGMPSAKARVTFWLEIAVNGQLQAFEPMAARHQTEYGNIFPELDVDVATGKGSTEQKDDTPVERRQGIPLSKKGKVGKNRATNTIPAPELRFGIQASKIGPRPQKNLEPLHGIPQSKARVPFVARAPPQNPTPASIESILGVPESKSGDF